MEKIIGSSKALFLRQTVQEAMNIPEIISSGGIRFGRVQRLVLSERIARLCFEYGEFLLPNELQDHVEYYISPVEYTDFYRLLLLHIGDIEKLCGRTMHIGILGYDYIIGYIIQKLSDAGYRIYIGSDDQEDLAADKSLIHSQSAEQITLHGGTG